MCKGQRDSRYDMKDWSSPRVVIRIENMHQLELLSIIQITDHVTSNVVMAYFDPGSGSFIFQLIIAALAGILFTLRRYWSNVVNWIKRQPRGDDSETNELDESRE